MLVCAPMTIISSGEMDTHTPHILQLHVSFSNIIEWCVFQHLCSVHVVVSNTNLCLNMIDCCLCPVGYY
jgi:hypothetical protein